MDTWHDMSQSLINQIELKMRGGERKYLILLLFLCERGRGREVQDFFWRFTEFHWSEFIKIRTKVHCLDEGYAHIPKMRDFIEDPKEKIWGN